MIFINYTSNHLVKYYLQYKYHQNHIDIHLINVYIISKTVYDSIMNQTGQNTNESNSFIKFDSQIERNSAYEADLSNSQHSQNNIKFNNYERIQTMTTIDRLNEVLESDFNSFDEADEFIINHIDEQAELIVHLQTQLSKKDSGAGRKSQVLDLLINCSSISILDISKKLNISTKNVSSQLTYLRSDGYKIFTDHRGRKVLNHVVETENDSSDE